MIKLVPYIHYDGIPTFRDSDIKGFYDRMVSDGTVDIVLYDGLIHSADDFLRFMKSDGVHLFVCYVEQEIMGIAWLNKIELTRAWFHFCGFSSSWGKDAAAIAKETAETLIRQQHNGKYLFDVLLGIVPYFNDRASRFLEECGGKIVGEVPYSIWSKKENKSVSGLLIYYVREEDRENLHRNQG